MPQSTHTNNSKQCIVQNVLSFRARGMVPPASSPSVTTAPSSLPLDLSAPATSLGGCGPARAERRHVVPARAAPPAVVLPRRQRVCLPLLPPSHGRGDPWPRRCRRRPGAAARTPPPWSRASIDAPLPLRKQEGLSRPRRGAVLAVGAGGAAGHVWGRSGSVTGRAARGGLLLQN